MFDKDDLVYLTRDGDAKYVLYLPHILNRTRHLTFEQRGVYMDLIYLYALHDQKLPDNDAIISVLLNCEVRDWRRIKAELIELRKIKSLQGMLLINYRDMLIAEWGHEDEEFIERRKVLLSSEPKKCEYCGNVSGPFEIDHKTPLSRGGTHAMRNLAVVCRSCNRSKGTKTLDEWVQ